MQALVSDDSHSIKIEETNVDTFVQKVHNSELKKK